MGCCNSKETKEKEGAVSPESQGVSSYHAGDTHTVVTEQPRSPKDQKVENVNKMQGSSSSLSQDNTARPVSKAVKTTTEQLSPTDGSLNKQQGKNDKQTKAEKTSKTKQKQPKKKENVKIQKKDKQKKLDKGPKGKKNDVEMTDLSRLSSESQEKKADQAIKPEHQTKKQEQYDGIGAGQDGVERERSDASATGINLTEIEENRTSGPSKAENVSEQSVDKQEQANRHSEEKPSGPLKAEDDSKQSVDKQEQAKKEPGKDKSNEKQLKKKLEEEQMKNKTLEKKVKQLEKQESLLMTATSDRDYQIVSLKAEVSKLKEEKDNLLTRLSAVAGAKLLDNNPNIADLSDTNRPTKLAEQYSELYDNEWTDAFTVLQSDGLDEYQCIMVLLTMLTTIYKMCKEKADSQSKELLESIAEFLKDEELPPEMSKHFKESRKKNYKKYLPGLTEVMKSKLKTITDVTSKRIKSTTSYQDKCLEICWLMCIQDPPVYLDCHTLIQGKTFRKDTYKEYTKSGPIIDFIVWPPVYLHKGGAMLCKGTAQCTQSKDDIFLRQNRSVGQHGVSVHVSGAISLPFGENLSRVMNMDLTNKDRRVKSENLPQNPFESDEDNIKHMTTKKGEQTKNREQAKSEKNHQSQGEHFTKKQTGSQKRVIAVGGKSNERKTVPGGQTPDHKNTKL